MKFTQLKKSLETKIEPIYQLIGEDYFLINAAYNEILSAVKINNPEFNSARLSEASLSDVFASCNQFTLFCDRRLVYVESIKPFTSREKQLWAAYAKNPNPHTVLVISSPVITGLTGETVDCGTLETDELAAWIKERVALDNKTISHKNALHLIKYSKGNMSQLKGELEKLIAYCEREITAEAIDALVCKNEEYEIYELANSAGRKDLDGAISILDYLLSSGKEPAALLSAMYSTFRKLFYISLNKELSNEKLADLLGGKPYGIGKLRETAENFTAARLLKALSQYRAADIDLKTVSSNKADRLELLLLTLTNS